MTLGAPCFIYWLKYLTWKNFNDIGNPKMTLVVWAKFSFEFGLVLAILFAFFRHFATFLVPWRRQPVVRVTTFFLNIYTCLDWLTLGEGEATRWVRRVRFSVSSCGKGAILRCGNISVADLWYAYSRSVHPVTPAVFSHIGMSYELLIEICPREITKSNPIFYVSWELSESFPIFYASW